MTRTALAVVAALLVACGSLNVAPSRATAPPLAACPDCATRTDLELGVAFPAPARYDYTPADDTGPHGIFLTGVGRLANYDLGSAPPAPAQQDLLVELFRASRSGQDLAAIARTSLPCTQLSAQDLVVAGRRAYRVEGECANGARVYVLIALTSDDMLVLSAWPRDSVHLDDFERILANLVVQ